MFILTIFALAILLFWGIPAVARFSAFFSDFKRTSGPIDTLDSTPPPPPYLEPLPETTNLTHIEIKGQTEAGATVTIILNNDENEVLANNEGQFQLKLALQDGENTLKVFATDISGNVGQKTDLITITYDNQPPILEIMTPEDGSVFYGSKQRQIVIEGKTEEGARVQINSRQVVVDPDDTFTFMTSLAEGDNTFNIKAQDAAGNITEKSLSLKFTP